MFSRVEAMAKTSNVSFDDAKNARLKTIPAGRFGTPDEFGALCAFICSAHASYLTGQNFLIDGGAYPGTF
jgi:3-oxoacyl-[acyl-carrier protein] reductase